MKYEAPKMDMILLSEDDAIMTSFEANTLDLWDMLMD